MDALETLRTRRSIRKFTGQDVTDDELKILLECAMLAPSAKNEQPWQFFVVRDQAVRERLAQASPYTGMAAHAPVVIVVMGDTREEKAPGFWEQDCAAATENLLLAARATGLGAVWCGIHPEKEREAAIRQVLEIPAQVIPFALVCVGHPAQEAKEASRFKPDRVHFEKW